MRNMKDSGIEWIGDIPEDWKVGKVKDYYKLQIGFTPDTKNEFYYDDENGYDWVTISDLTNDRFIFETKNKISQGYINEQTPKIIPENSLLYSFKLSVGKVCFTGKDMYSNEAIVSFLNSKNCNLNFLYYSSFMIINNANENIYGAKILNQNLIKNANIIFPSLEEQELIADYLDNKVSEIDNIISKTKETIEEYKKYKQSVITEAVTKGLNPDVEMKDSGIEWIGEIPKHWEVRKINSLFNIVGSGTTPKSTENQLYDGNINWIQSGDINGNIIYETAKHVSQEAIDKISSLKIYKSPFIVIAMYGASIANISLSKIDGCVNQACCVLSNGKYNIKYIFYILKASKQEFILQSVGGTQPNISQEIIKSFRIPISTSQIEQNKISSYLDKKCEEIDTLINKKEQLIIELEEYKKSLIYECVTGKKEVSPAYAY